MKGLWLFCLGNVHCESFYVYECGVFFVFFSLSYFLPLCFASGKQMGKRKWTWIDYCFVSFCVSLQNAKPFSSSDSLAKVQEVASWLLEMNQDLLSGGSSSRRSRGPGGSAVRGNASSTARAPQQAAEEGDEDEHMNRVVEEEEQLQQRVSQRSTYD